MISVIVPIYRVEKYLSRCIESLIHQTYRDIEIILVTDGSSDSCGEISDGYAGEDARIIVVHQKNKGVSAARNAGLKIAKGEYIGFCDPDDWAAPEMYEELFNALKNNSADISICGYHYYDEDYRCDEKRIYEVRSTEVIDQKTMMDRMSDMPPTIRHGVWNKLFIADKLDGLLFDENLHSSEDLAFLNQYLKRMNKAVLVHKPLYQNLVRLGSATHGGLSIKDLWLSYRVHEEMYWMVVDMYPELHNRAMAYLLDVLLLKYNMAKRKLSPLNGKQQKIMLCKMRLTLKKYAIMRGIADPEIYWKTRIAYLLVR